MPWFFSYPLPMRRFEWVLAVAVCVLVASPEGDAAKKKPRPTPTATPTPTPVPLLRAAGSCLSYVPGKSLVLAEVGRTGKVFRIDSKTRIETRIRSGARLRILYAEAPDGPVARSILPGPIVATPTPVPAK